MQLEIPRSFAGIVTDNILAGITVSSAVDSLLRLFRYFWPFWHGIGDASFVLRYVVEYGLEY